VLPGADGLQTLVGLKNLVEKVVVRRSGRIFVMIQVLGNNKEDREESFADN
jgi:hypothetical protein